MKKILLSFIFALLTQILISYSPNIVNAQGTISCLEVKDTITGKMMCATTSVNCEQGFQAPAKKCEDYAKENNSCPGIISCINPNITPSPTPPQKTTPSPAKDVCGGIQEKCCGTISPLTCNAGFIPNRPNDPNSCVCQPSPNLSCNITATAHINVDSPNINCVSSKCPASFNCDAKPLYGPLLDSANCVCYGYNAPTTTPTPIPTIRPPAPPCNKYVLVSNENADVTQEVRDGTIDPKNAPFKCVQINSAIGGLETDVTKAIKRLFTIILSLSGGIATLLIIYSGYRLMTSGGNPEKVQGAKETLTSAIVGLLFIIFSLAILQIIGVDILKLPGFDK